MQEKLEKTYSEGQLISECVYFFKFSKKQMTNLTNFCLNHKPKLQLNFLDFLPYPPKSNRNKKVNGILLSKLF